MKEVHMNIEIISQYFVDYGALAIFVIVLLEYLNLLDSRQELSCRLQEFGPQGRNFVFYDDVDYNIRWPIRKLDIILGWFNWGSSTIG